MQVKIFRDLDISKLEEDINKFIDTDHISVKDIKVTTDIIYDCFDQIARPLRANTGTTVVVIYEENDYGYYE